MPTNINILKVFIVLLFFTILINPFKYLKDFDWNSWNKLKVQTASILLATMEENESDKTETQNLKYENIIENLEAEIEELKLKETCTTDPETKVVIKKVPVEKIVYKEVIKETACDPSIPIISSIKILTGLDPTSIKWETNKLTKSKVIITSNEMVGKKEVNSIFPTAKGHRANIEGLQPKVRYFYEIYATTIEKGKELGSARATGSFFVSSGEQEEE